MEEATLTVLTVLGVVWAAAATLVAIRRRRAALLAGDPHGDAASAAETHRISPGWTIFLVAFGLVFLLGGLATIVFSASGFFARSATSGVVLVGFATVLIVLGAYFIADTLRSRLRLSGDLLELDDLTGVRRIRLREVASRYLIAANGVRTLVLVPKAAGRPNLRVPLLFSGNAAVLAFVASVPSFERLAAQAAEEAVAANPAHGATREKRLGRLRSARKLSKVAGGVAIGLVAWGWFLPRPYPLVVALLIATPWAAVAFVARSKGLYTLNGSRKDGRPDLAVLVLMPGFILMLRALIDLNVIDYVGAFTGMGVVTAALVGAIAWADVAVRRFAPLILLGLLLCAYGYGATVLANACLDRAAPATFQARVIDRHITSGRSRRPELWLGPWGPVAQGRSNVSVSWDTYRAVPVGGFACVRLHAGALGIAWYVVNACDDRAWDGGSR